MNPLIVLLASLGAVLALAGIARLLGLGAEPRLASREDALAEARAHHFDAIEAELEDEGRAARLTDARGRAARLRRHGNHFVLTDA